MHLIKTAVLEMANGPVAKCAQFLSGATRYLQIMWPKFILLAIVNEWDLQLVAILGHKILGCLAFGHHIHSALIKRDNFYSE